MSDSFNEETVKKSFDEYTKILGEQQRRKHEEFEAEEKAIHSIYRRQLNRARTQDKKFEILDNYMKDLQDLGDQKLQYDLEINEEALSEMETLKMELQLVKAAKKKEDEKKKADLKPLGI